MNLAKEGKYSADIIVTKFQAAGESNYETWKIHPSV